jgi:beta-galactosidase
LRPPKLWSQENPSLYRAEVEVFLRGEIVDHSSTTFGIRKIEVDAEGGLRLNGEAVKLKGGCMHHDNGVLGAATIDRAEERRVQLLKANGYNAIRTSHNPPSPALLDACDHLGMLVIDEAFDMWEQPNNPQDYHRFFDDWWQRDISSMVRRDRNHPSVIFWSIGNEIPERAEPKGVEIAGWLVSEVKRHDSTRPVTMAVCEFWNVPGATWSQTDPAFVHLDVGGYNYQWKQYESDHQRLPQRVMMGTESFPSEAFENWQLVEKHSYVLGDFVWTAMDYLGEVGIGHSMLADNPDAFSGGYPWFNSYCGDIDLIGDKKPQSYFRDVVWGRSRLEMAVQRPIPQGRREKISAWGWSDELRSWTWPGFEGKPLNVRVYSSGDQVRLQLNGKDLGIQPISAATKLRAEFSVPYSPGKLRAVALQNGTELASLSFRTAGAPAKLRLMADRLSIRPDRNDLSYVTVEVLDATGNLVPDAIVPVTLSISGAGQLAGVGNADPKDVASFQQPHRKTFHGKCLAVVRPTGIQGSITLRAEAQGLSATTVTINVLSH